MPRDSIRFPVLLYDEDNQLFMRIKSILEQKEKRRITAAYVVTLALKELANKLINAE